MERVSKILDLMTSKQLSEVMCYRTCSFVKKMSLEEDESFSDS